MTQPETYAEQTAGVTTIWLNRPRVKNAIDQQGWAAIKSQMALADLDPECRVIVIRGVGGNFGAGADIGEFAHVFETPGSTLAYFAAMEAAMQSIEHSPKPVIAAVEGLCIGACVALSLACDIRIASDQGVFAITPARLGIVYPYGDVSRVVAAIGPGRTKSLLFSGRKIDAREASDIGLVDHLVDGSAFASELEKLSRSIANASLWTVTASKRAVRALMDGLDAESAGYPDKLSLTVVGEDFIEGACAFREKRQPHFSFSIP